MAISAIPNGRGPERITTCLLHYPDPPVLPSASTVERIRIYFLESSPVWTRIVDLDNELIHLPRAIDNSTVPLTILTQFP